MDFELILKLKNAEIDALDLIIDKYYAYVFTVVKNFSQAALTTEDIEEIVSDVFVSLWKNADRLNEDKSLRPYLSVIAKNCVKNKFRSSKGVKFEKLEENIPTNDFLKTTDTNQAMKYIYEALDSMTETSRNIFIRFYFYGEKITEISKKMNLSSSNVKTTLHRARKTIKKFLTERGYD